MRRAIPSSKWSTRPRASVTECLAISAMRAVRARQRARAKVGVASRRSSSSTWSSPLCLASRTVRFTSFSSAPVKGNSTAVVSRLNRVWITAMPSRVVDWAKMGTISRTSTKGIMHSRER